MLNRTQKIDTIVTDIYQSLVKESTWTKELDYLLCSLRALLKEDNQEPVSMSLGSPPKSPFPVHYTPAQILVLAYLTRRPSVNSTLNTDGLGWQPDCKSGFYKLNSEQWKAFGAALTIMKLNQVDLSNCDLYRLSAEQWKGFSAGMALSRVSWVGLSNNYLSFLLPDAPPLDKSTFQFWSAEPGLTPEFKASSLQAIEGIFLNSKIKFGLNDSYRAYSRWSALSDNPLIDYLEQKSASQNQVKPTH